MNTLMTVCVYIGTTIFFSLKPRHQFLLNPSRTRNMKQKIVIRVQIKCDKCRSKAMKLVAATGVDSVAIGGEDKDHLVIVGDDIDPANLTCILRKKIGHANILKVEKAKKYKLESVVQLYPNYPQCSQVVLYDYESCSSNTNACSIM